MLQIDRCNMMEDKMVGGAFGSAGIYGLNGPVSSVDCLSPDGVHSTSPLSLHFRIHTALGSAEIKCCTIRLF